MKLGFPYFATPRTQNHIFLNNFQSRRYETLTFEKVMAVTVAMSVPVGVAVALAVSPVAVLVARGGARGCARGCAYGRGHFQLK